MVASAKKRKEAKKTNSSGSKTRKQGGSKYAKEDSAQKSCGKIGNNWSGKEEGTGKIRGSCLFHRETIE